MTNQSFALNIKAFYPKRRCSPKEKKVNTHFAAATCVGRGTIQHCTKVNINNSTRVKKPKHFANRDRTPGHTPRTGTVPATMGLMVSLCRPGSSFGDPPSIF